jgi:putative membrane protein
VVLTNPQQENEMLKKNVVKGVLGLSAAAALLAVVTGYAQTPATDNGQPGANSQSTAGQATATQPATTGTGQTGATGTSTGQAGTTASGTGTMANLARSDQKLIKDLAQANMAEIEAGRVAKSKSQNEQVKNFAQQMIDDHTKALDDVKQLAQAKGVTLPTELDRTHKRQADRMAALSGDAFDRAYLERAGVADHKKTHAMLQRAQTRAKDPDVKALVARTLPIVDQHMTAVQQLNRDTARGGSRTQGTTGSSNDKKESTDKKE